MSELFRKIDEDFGGSISWNTQPNCRVFDELYTTGLTFYGTAHASTFHQICIHSPTCRTSILEGATFHKMSSCKFLWGNPCKPSIHSTTGTSSLGLRVLDAFRSFCCMKEFGDVSTVSFSHAYSYRGGNCNCLLSHTARWFPTANILQESFVRAVLSPDSWPRRFFHHFHFCRQNSYFVCPARYFFSPLSSICADQVLFSSDVPPYCTIPIRSWVSQTLVFLVCTLLQDVFRWDFFMDNKFPSHFESNSWVSSFRRTVVNRSA